MSSERQAFNDGFDKGYAKAQERIAQLEAENGRLREALEKLYPLTYKYQPDPFREIIDTALKAGDD